MTGNELRQKVANIMLSWLGATRGSATHKKILNIYNNHKPLARGYAVQVNDAWCATTVSAAWIEAGIADYTGTECSCTQFIAIAKKKGFWVENDAYVPKIGDALIYDWDDGTNYATNDNAGGPEHIGIVTKVDGNTFYVTEGNKGSSSVVGTRTMKVNGRYIRGFIAPNYDAIAKAITPKSATTPTVTSAVAATKKEDTTMKRYNTIADIKKEASWATDTIQKLITRKALNGDGKGLDLSYDMVRMLVVMDRMGLFK